MKTKEEVLQLLVYLGETEQEVADKLISLGIKGDPRNCKVCPIAQYLISNGVALRVEASTRSAIAVGVAINYHWFPLLEYPQVKPVYDFIRSFDSGKYPQLVKLH